MPLKSRRSRLTPAQSRLAASRLSPHPRRTHPVLNPPVNARHPWLPASRSAERNAGPFERRRPLLTSMPFNPHLGPPTRPNSAVCRCFAGRGAPGGRRFASSPLRPRLPLAYYAVCAHTGHHFTSYRPGLDTTPRFKHPAHKHKPPSRARPVHLYTPAKPSGNALAARGAPGGRRFASSPLRPRPPDRHYPPRKKNPNPY